MVAVDRRYILCLCACLLACGCQEQAAPDLVAENAPSQAELVRGRIQFVEGYHAGCEAARTQGKPMLLFFTARWCDYCHAMAKDAFCQDAVVSLSQRFTCVLVDADLEPDVCHQFRVRGYPTIQFLSPRGVPLNRVTGKQPGHHLVMEMQAALQAVARRIDEPGAARAL
jgi:thioredoxin-related protein